MSAYVGIDVSKATLDIAIHNPDKPHHFQIANTPAGHQQLVQHLLTRSSIECVGLEASGRYGEPVAQTLYEAGFAVCHINPKQIHNFAQVHLHYNKTDKQDAWLIARFCQAQQPPLWQPTYPIHQQLQQQTRYLRSLEAMRQQERNRLQSGLGDCTVRFLIQSHIDPISTQIQALQQAIYDLIEQHTQLQQQHQLLTSIPGIGAKSAAVLLAEIGDIHRFANARQLAAWVGFPHANFNRVLPLSDPVGFLNKATSIYALLSTCLLLPRDVGILSVQL